MTAIKGLLFDKDGTLFDFRSTWGGWTRRVVRDLSGGDPVRESALAKLLGFDLATGDFAADSAVIAHTTAEIRDLVLPHLTATDADDLRNHLGDRLVRYKVPRSFEFVTEPLRDEAGKVRRSQLRADRVTPPPTSTPSQETHQ
mgnify:CR=1 FL=1